MSKMRILWLCNIIPPVIARELHRETSNKEGWLSGLLAALLRSGREAELGIAFPVPERGEISPSRIRVEDRELVCYGFYEDTGHPERFDEGLEQRLGGIVEDFQPQLVHCFGTEYPHTLAMCRVFPRKEGILVGIQGLCAVYAGAYFADLPERVIRSVTLRDLLRRDSLIRQQKKYERRGRWEREALALAGNVTGRTAWDRHYAREWNPGAVYYEMNETLREEFYGPVWRREDCEPHRIFVSQGDYPIKGLHYLLRALPRILERYPDARVYVAGGNLTACGSLGERLRFSAYGRYLRSLLAQGNLWEKVVFTGRLSAARMREQYLKSGLFLCCSSIENSPNSLGEAMLLGMPCVSADVGGIPSLFEDGRDGILYEGYRAGEGSCGNPVKEEPLKAASGGPSKEEPLGAAAGSPSKEESLGAAAGGPSKADPLEANAGRLAEAVLAMWEADKSRQDAFCASARAHALRTHDRHRNGERLLDIYGQILGRIGEGPGEGRDT